MQFSLNPSAIDPDYGEAILPLDLAKRQLQLEVDETDQDNLIVSMRAAAIDMVEHFANLRMGPVAGQVATFAGFSDPMRVGVGPLATFVVTAVSYDGGTTGPVVIGSDGWRLDGLGGLLPARGSLWPFGVGRVTITYSAGYPDGMCPPSLLTAASICLAHLFRDREGGEDMPAAAAALARPYRMPVL